MVSCPHTKVMLALGDGLSEEETGVTQPASRTQSNPASAFIVGETVPPLGRLRKNPIGPSGQPSTCDLTRFAKQRTYGINQPVGGTSTASTVASICGPPRSVPIKTAATLSVPTNQT